MNELPVQDQPAAAVEERGGCGLLILFIVSVFAILTATVLAQISAWIVEQGIFEGSLKITDYRWAIYLGFGLLITIPAAIIQALVSNPFYKRIYRTILFAGLYCVALVPVHFASVTSAQLTNVLQIGTSIIFAAGFILWHRRRSPAGSFFKRPAAPALLIALVAGIVCGYLWLARGAFGSPLDTLLNLLAGLSFGVVSALIVWFGLFKPRADDPQPYRLKDLLLHGFIASLAVTAAATAFGHNGSQPILAVVVPWSAWIMAVYFGRTGRGASLWPAAMLTGMAAAWPLMMIDPDELSIVINSGAGELIEVAIRTGAWSLLIGLVLVVLAFINPRRSPTVTAGLAAAAVLGAGVIYALAGQPGFYGERLFVIMNQQVDLGDISRIESAAERRGQVFRVMTAEAEKSQADLRAALDGMHVAYKPYYLINSLEVDGGPFVRWRLENRADVDRVLDSPRLRPLPDQIPTAQGELQSPDGDLWNLDMIHARQVQEELGISGKGIVVGQSDSGVYGQHQEIADSYRGKDGKNDYNWFDPWFGSQEPADKNGHGTHTLGTILGNHVGVAPDAEWIGCVNLGRNLGNPAVYLECMQFMLAPFPQKGDPFKDGKPELGANVMNNSWGCPFVEGCDPGTYVEAVKALRAAGVFVVVSTGNSGLGGCGTVTDPIAIYDEVLSVGAVTSTGQRAEFSSLGPVTVDGSNRTKPDIMAPGEEVFSSYPGDTYSIASGTSMAGPHLVGVVALMWSANPNLIGEIDRTTEIIESTADRVMDTRISCESTTSYPNNETGYGLVNAYEAVRKAIEAR